MQKKCVVNIKPRGLFDNVFRVLTLTLMVLSTLMAQPPSEFELTNQQLSAIRGDLVFERNVGQYESQFLFVARDRQASYCFMNGEVQSVVQQSEGETTFSYGMKFVGASAGAKPIGVGQSENKGQYNILEGPNFYKNVPQHNQLRYPNVWDNIHIYFGQSAEGLKYDFVVNPGGNINNIAFELVGVTNLRVTPDGELAFNTPFGELRKGRPFTYQQVNGQQVEVASRYVVQGNIVSFNIGDYDASKQLIIDPVALKWATVLGGGDHFQVRASYFSQETGHLYLTGEETGVVFPNTSGFLNSPDPTQAFVLCMKADGSEILWKTSIQTGNTYSTGRGLTVDSQGNVYIYTETNPIFEHPYRSINPQIPGPLLRMTPGFMNGGGRALFKLSAAGDELKYFTLLIHNTLPGLEPQNHYNGGTQPMLIDFQGRVVIPVVYRKNNWDDGTYPTNVFSPRGANAFGVTSPSSNQFTNILTLDTDVPGEAGIVESSLVDFRIRAAGKDAAGNLYFSGLQGRLLNIHVARLYQDFFHPSYFTHMVFDTAAIHNYLRNFGCCGRLGNVLNHGLFKLSPDQQEIIYGSYVGYQITDYMDSVWDPWMAVSEEGDVYFNTSYYLYSDIGPNRRDLATHSAPKQVIIQDWEDVYNCGGWCLGINLAEKRPAGNYQNPEWMIQYPAGGWYWAPYVSYDNERDMVHLLSKQDPFVLTPGTKPFVTDGAFQTEASSNDKYNDFSHYMQVTSAGDVVYATITSPEYSPSALYEVGLSGIHVNEANGDVFILEQTNIRDEEHKSHITPSYRDFDSGEQVPVVGGNLIPPLNGKRKSTIKVFHNAHPGQNIINDFASGDNTFCVGSLIGFGMDALPIDGNQVEFKSGDGSLPEHNLPLMYIDGVRTDHPTPAAGIPVYTWQSKLRPEGETEFGPWENIPGGTKFFLEPHEALTPGTHRYRRLVSIAGYNLVSNEIELNITGTLQMEISGPDAPVYFCKDVNKDLNMAISNVGGTISWQWYMGFNPVGDQVISPSSGSGVLPESFTAAIAAGNTLSGNLRLLVTDDASGCQRQFFVTIQELTDKISNRSTITLCPGVESVTLGPRVANPDWDYRYTSLSDMRTLNGLRPVVSTPGVYRLVISIAGENAYCVAGTTEVTIVGSSGDYDSGLQASGPYGFCATDSPSIIGPLNAPVNGYSYKWRPSIGLSNDTLSTPSFNPAAAAALDGIRTINYIFEATRISDGCVYSSLVTVNDTTQAEATVPQNPISGSACSAGSLQLYASAVKGRFFEWRAVATNYPGGLAALEASSDYGLGARGQLVSTLSEPMLFYPEGSGYYIDFSFKISYGVIGQTECYTELTIRADFFCGGVGGFNCIPINGYFADPVCSGPNTLLSAQSAAWLSSSWTVVSVDGVPVPDGTQPRGLFVATPTNQKGEALVSGSNHPPLLVAHLEDTDWGFPGAQIVRYRFTGVIEVNGDIITCVHEINVNGLIPIAPFELVDTLEACLVLPPGNLIGGVGVTLPYTLSITDYDLVPSSAYRFKWTVLNGTGGSVNPTNSMTPVFNPIQFSKYEFRVMDPITGCFESDTLTFSINTLTVNAGLDITACPGSIVEVGSSASLGLTYSWSPGAGLFFPNPSTPDSMVAKPLLIMPQSTVGTALTVTVTDPLSGCSATDEVLLFSSLDAPPTPSAATITACTGVAVELGQANYPRSDVGFVWQSVNGSDLSWLSSTNKRLVTLSIPNGFFGTVSYSVKAIAGLCGESAPAIYTINVPDPGITMSTGPVTAGCSTPLVLLENNTINLPSGFSGEWFPKSGLFSNDSGTTPYSAESDVNVYVSAPNEATTYTFRVRHTTTGCAAVYTRQVLPPPGAPEVDAGGTLTYCGDPISMGISDSPGSQYSWAAVGINTNPSGSPQATPDAVNETLMLSYLNNLMVSRPTFSQITLAPGAYRYRLTVTDGNGCSISDDVIIRVPNFQKLSLPTSVMLCQDVPTQLITTPAPSTYSYQWRELSPNASESTISDISSASALFTPQGRTTYELYYIDPSSGCNLTQQVTVGIAPSLLIPAVEPQVFCEPTASVDLTAAVTDYNTLTGIKWFRSLYPGVIIPDPNAVNINGSEVYYLESSNEFGCTDTVAVQVLFEQVSMPVISDLVTLSLLSNTINLGGISTISPSTTGGRLVWHTNPVYQASEELESLMVGPGKYYLSEVSANGCVGTSAALTVYKRPYINLLSTDLICAGSVATPIMANAAGGFDELSYRWQKSSTDPAIGATWMNINDSEGLTLYPGVLNEPTWFRVQVSLDGIDFTTLAGSNAIKINVDTNDPPTIQLNTVSEASDSPVLCNGVLISGLYHTTTGATGIGEMIGLPAGVTASWQRDTIRIQGAPTVSGSFNYSIQLTGGCGNVSAIGVISVLDAFDRGSIASSGESLCHGGTPAKIGSISPASGGDGNFTYSWRSSADNFTAAIVGATAETYTPPAGLTETVTYQRYVSDAFCGSNALLSAGAWTVTVLPLPVLNGPQSTTKATSEDGPGNCMVLFSWTHPVEIAGACTPQELRMSINDGAVETVIPGEMISREFEPGDYEISYLLFDGAENTVEYSFELRVVDDESPTVNCAPSIEVLFNGEETITLSMSDIGTATDNCSLMQTSLIPSVVSVTQLGQVVPILLMAEDAAGNVSGCLTNVDLGGLPSGWSQNHSEVGSCDAETLFDPQTGVWTGAAINCRYGVPFTADAMMFARYQLCGDGSITAEVSGLSGALPYAGIAMRETGDPGTKKVQMMINRISNILRREIRLTTGGQAYPMHFSSPCERTWLRIVRTGNIFRGYTSQDGVTWWYVMNVHVPMNSCIEMGLVLTNMQPNVLDRANFRNVTVTGGAHGPTLWRAGMEESLESDSELLDVNVYPNPVSGEMQVDLSAFAGKSVRLSLYNMQGQAVLVQQLPAVTDYLHRLDMSKIPVGVYSLRVQTSGAAEVSRRVVVHRP